VTATYDDDVAETVLSVWETLFDFPLNRLGGDPSAPPDRGVTALVQLEGAWQGAVMLQCSTTLAEELTALMFNTDATPIDEDVRDALGELANMVAGNIKTVLTQPSNLGLPVVAFGNDYEVRILGAEAVSRVCFDCEFGRLRVSLMRRTDPEAPAK
jgi:chemotaxis protein CheX